jgi:hypothetical protein
MEIIPANPSPRKRKKPTRKDKGKKVVGVEELDIDTEEIWRENFQSNEGIDFNDPIIQEKMTNITSKITEKIKKTREVDSTRDFYDEEDLQFIGQTWDERSYGKR